MVPFYWFSFSDCAIPQKLKKHFPEGEFQRNLAKSSRSLIETHLLKQNLEIFTERFYRQNSILPHVKICLFIIYANKLESDASIANFSFRPKTPNHECDNKKNNGWKITRKVVKYAKNRGWVPRTTPLNQSVKSINTTNKLYKQYTLLFLQTFWYLWLTRQDIKLTSTSQITWILRNYFRTTPFV